MVAKNQRFQVGLLRETELVEAGRIMRLAFGTFLGLPNPMDFMDDRDFISPRWRSRNTKVLAAREDGKLIGLTVVSRWGSFRLLGPLAILPDYWNRGVAQQLFAAAMKVFDRWGVRHSGLFTFAEQSHARLLVPEVWLLARLSHGDHEARAGSALADADKQR